MQEEFETEFNTNTNTVVEPQTSLDVQSETKLDDLPRLEDLRRSEKEVKTSSKIEGLEKAQETIEIEDKVFAKKVDEKRAYLKKRVKIIAGVYGVVVAILLAFVGINVATMVSMQNTIAENEVVITENTTAIEQATELGTETATGADIMVSLNEPRDYSDDTKELTFFDKITILFRNLFG